MKLLRQYLLLMLLLAIFGTFLLWPIVQVVKVGFTGIDGSGFTLRYIESIFLDPGLRQGLINSATIAICVTLLCTAIAVPLALMSVRLDFWGKGIFSGLLLVPLILPPFVGAIGMRQILGRFGVLTAIAQHLDIVSQNSPIDWIGKARLGGIILLESLSLYPILFLNVSAALANLDPAMEQAAANLGASRWTVFRKITLPLMRPGLFAGGTIVLIWSFTELGTPLMFDFYTATPVQIFHRITQVSGSPVPYALVVVMLFSSILLYIIGKFILGSRGTAGVTKASMQSGARQLNFLQSIPVLIPFALVSGLALLPHLGVIVMSFAKVGTWYQSALPHVFTFDHYVTGLTHPLTLPSVKNSIFYASFSSVIDIALGLLIAFMLVRTKLPGRQILDSLSMLPLAVPGLVLAFGYLAISIKLQASFAPQSTKWILELLIGPDPQSPRPTVALVPAVQNFFQWAQHASDVTQNPTLLLIVAYAMRRLPYVVRSAVAGLEQTPEDLELAARNIGASKWTTLTKITIPLIAANLIAGGLLAFAFAMLEVSDSLILAQKETHWPITQAIYQLFGRLGDGPYIASALGVWAMLILTLTILSANSLLGRRMGAIFRV